MIKYCVFFVHGVAQCDIKVVLDCFNWEINKVEGKTSFS